MITLTWKVDLQVPASPPTTAPDPYTGEVPMMIHAVYHFRDVERTMSKEFETKELAEEFMKKAPKNCRDFKILMPLLHSKETGI